MMRLALAGLFFLGATAGAPPSAEGEIFKKAQPFSANNFSVRTVKPPSSGARKRIVLQGDTPKRPASRRVAYDWFWNEVDPAISAADPARFAVLGARFADRLGGGWAGFGGEPRARSFAVDHQAAITEAAKRRNISPAFLLAVIAVESAGRTRARSPKGAQGLMQLMPATARRFAVANPYDATQNIAGGAAYLDFLLSTFGEDPVLALAGYNAGEGAVTKHKGVPPYAETRDYVPKVLAAFLAIRKLCVEPPENVRDACALYQEF